MSTHNQCLRAKIRKKCIPLYTPVLLYNSGVSGGITTRTCYPAAYLVEYTDFPRFLEFLFQIYQKPIKTQSSIQNHLIN